MFHFLFHCFLFGHRLIEIWRSEESHVVICEKCGRWETADNYPNW